MDKRIEGINVRENTRGIIDLGCHKETLIRYLSSLPTTSTGYFNILLIPNSQPSRTGGYTHKAVVKQKDFVSDMSK